MLIILPHLIWLTENDYITITYGLQRTGGVGSFIDHLIYPLIFLTKQIGLLAPFLFIFFFLVKKTTPKLNLKDEKLVFLFLTTIAPIFLMLLTSMIMGAKIRTMWMTPFYLFSGTFIIYIFKSQINLNKLQNFASIFIILFIFSPLAYVYVSITQTDKRTDFPGKQKAKEVQSLWDQKYKSEIYYVIGDEWYAGNLSYHLKSRPKWVSINDKTAPELMNSKERISLENIYPALVIGKK